MPSQGALAIPALGKLRQEDQHAPKTSLVGEIKPHFKKGLGPIPQMAAIVATSVLFNLKYKYCCSPPVENTNVPIESSLTIEVVASSGAMLDSWA